VAPISSFFGDCTSLSASSLLACLNSIMQSRKSFRTSPFFSLNANVTNIKFMRNVRAGLHSSNRRFRKSKVYHLSFKTKRYI
jgi:hypothetical protein